MAALDIILHLLLVIAAPPLLLGVINKTKAWFAGRVGPPLLQAYFDIFKLLRREMVISTTTTWVFLAGPALGATTALGAALIVPLGHHPAPLAFDGDMILLAYLLGLGRFFTASAALDTGSSFEGMGAAREVTFSSLAEPALFLGLIAMARMTQMLSLSDIFSGGAWLPSSHQVGVLTLVAVGWFIILLAENCRIPFDDPNTHLELTMIHEVMVLDHSGPALGLVTYGAAVKLFVLSALLMNIALPFRTGHSMADWLIFLAGMTVLSVLIGIIESSMARLRLDHVPRLLISACLLCGFGVILQFV